MLLGLTWSHNGGWVLKVQVSEEDAEYFKSHTAKKGDRAGQIYACQFVLMGDDGKPETAEPPRATVLVSDVPASGVAPKGSTPNAEPKPRPPATEAQRAAMTGLCGLAIKWCADQHFQEWAAFTYPESWGEAFEKLAKNDDDAASYVVKRECGLESRKDLNDPALAGGIAIFKAKIMGPYVECRTNDGLPNE